MTDQQRRTGLLKQLLRNFIVLLAMGTCCLSAAKQPLPNVLLKTDLGDMLIELYPQQAPISVDNFLKYVTDYYYDGIIFHRVIQGFMIQAGGYSFDLSIKPPNSAPIINESANGLTNERGTLAMARTSDPDSATSQFFINHRTNKFLNHSKKRPGYAVFGKVIQGMDTLDKIAAVETATVGHMKDVPVAPVRILSARLLNPESWSPLPEAVDKPSFEAPIPVR